MCCYACVFCCCSCSCCRCCRCRCCCCCCCCRCCWWPCHVSDWLVCITWFSDGMTPRPSIWFFYIQVQIPRDGRLVNLLFPGWNTDKAWIEEPLKWETQVPLLYYTLGKCESRLEAIKRFAMSNILQHTASTTTLEAMKSPQAHSREAEQNLGPGGVQSEAWGRRRQGAHWRRRHEVQVMRIVVE